MVEDELRRLDMYLDMVEDGLRMMDHNTVNLMIENLKNELARKNEEIARQDEEIARLDEEIARLDEEHARLNEELAQKIRNAQSETIANLQDEITS